MFLVSKGNLLDFYFTSMQLVLSAVSPYFTVLYYKADYIFISFGIVEQVLVTLKIRYSSSRCKRGEGSICRILTIYLSAFCAARFWTGPNYLMRCLMLSRQCLIAMANCKELGRWLTQQVSYSASCQTCNFWPWVIMLQHYTRMAANDRHCNWS